MPGMKRVRCANCGYVYEREEPTKCPRCGSNAADSVEVKSSGAPRTEGQAQERRVLTDDLRWE